MWDRTQDIYMKSEAMSEGKPEKFYGGEYWLIIVVVINGSDKWRSLIINSLYVCWPSGALLCCRDFIRQEVEFIVLCIVRSEQQMTGAAETVQSTACTPYQIGYFYDLTSKLPVKNDGHI